EPMLRVPYDLPTFDQPVAVLDAAGGGHLVVARQGSIEDTGIPEEVCERFDGLFAWSFDAAPAGLLLQERFWVEVGWVGSPGQSGVGRPVVLTPDSGYFWFFGPDNVELMLKVLDGRSLNGHFWVFYASLSDVAYTITVTDTATGRVRAYDNASGQLASRGDTAAFPAAGASVAVPGSLLPGGPSSGLLLGDRFEVEVAWTNPETGISGIGYGVKLTDDSGYLWFFGPNNIELVVKVLDGRAVNGRYWVFYGALSNVEYTVRVRDTATGQVREYHNPPGQLRSHADTAAFPLPE
ncbi:MAG TPA: hypothetical protein VEL74_06605, partial [Thermoanaerobaculia bacterium]|nr:hypothetical protein [Thermoanaerobaculia bacterium]